MDELIENIRVYLMAQRWPEETAALAATAAGIVLLIALAWLANFVVKHIILRIVTGIVTRTRFTWDDALMKAGVFTRLSHLAPALVINGLGPGALGGSPAVLSGVHTAVNLYLIVILIAVLFAVLNTVQTLAERRGQAKGVPVKGFIQAIKLIALLLGVVFGLAILLGKTPLYLLSGVGALTAVLLLVFRDAILGFVAGIMISVNELVRIGDWIEMEKAGADGFVIDVSLTTVKVQNWDKTVTTIPSYDLISGSFKNWRAMFESGGRRIKRALHINMQSVCFADDAMIARWRRIALLRPYLDQKSAEIAAYNEQANEDLSVPGNGRRLTNLGTFRAYCDAYIRAHPGVNHDLIFMVRQLAPTPHGLPLELYVFTRDTRWVVHEAVQADIFDHLLAIIGEFGLTVFQQPSGRDVRELAAKLGGGAGPAGEAKEGARELRE